MSWRDQYQQGSFRGASFRTEYHERSGGRRVVSHEFPGRDDPVTEDLGRSQRTFSIDCWVAGADYRADRDALIDALEAFGPGLLVHPFHGSMNVNVLAYRQTEDTEEGGMCRFSIELVESGVAVAVAPELDGAAIVGFEADDVIGYLAKYKLRDEECVIVSSDKDFYQLLSPLSRKAAWQLPSQLWPSLF